MSGGCLWEPFEFSQAEYEDILEAIKSDPSYLPIGPLHSMVSREVRMKETVSRFRLPNVHVCRSCGFTTVQNIWARPPGPAPAAEVCRRRHGWNQEPVRDGEVLLQTARQQPQAQPKQAQVTAVAADGAA